MTPRAHRRPSPTSLPDFVPPELATLAGKVPEGDRWLHEIKLDGYRTAARIEGGQVRLLTRTGLDWTARFRSIAAALASLPRTDSHRQEARLVSQQDGQDRWPEPWPAPSG
jgi:bifunctional non-homologous end joining protein LigD